MVQELYTDSFGYEWRKWAAVQYEADNTGTRMAGHTTNMFRRITGWSDADIRDKLVVDFGCGGGRFLDLVRAMGGIAVGIDLSLAVEPARERLRGDRNVLVVQGDVLNPPFKRASFDAGYTIGVLHHTPDPATGLRRLAEAVKAGGRIACSVYPKNSPYDYPSLRLYRRIYRTLERVVGAGAARRLALGYAYFAAYGLYYGVRVLGRIPLLRRLITPLVRHAFVFYDIPDPRWRILDVFDAITPKYASTHSAEEVRRWFVDAGCTEIIQTDWGDTAYSAVRGSHGAQTESRSA